MMETQDHSEHSQDFDEYSQDDNEHTQGKMMLPPPLGVFETREILLKHVRDFALTQGYMVSIKDSSKDRYVTIACDRGGVYRRRLRTGENMRQRKTSSRLTNCPFEVVGKKDDDVWILTIKCGEHNHEPSKEMSDHPSCRRFTEEEVLLIRDMTVGGKRPRQILKALKQRNPSLVSDSRNIYNVKAKIRREMLSGEQPPGFIAQFYPISVYVFPSQFSLPVYVSHASSICRTSCELNLGVAADCSLQQKINL